MNATVTVDVTAEDISEGLEAVLSGQRSDTACPFTRALRRSYPNAVVYTGSWRPTRDQRTSAALSATARAFVSAFDASLPGIREARKNHDDAKAARLIEATVPKPAQFHEAVAS